MTIRDGATLGPREALPPKILKKKNGVYTWS